MKFVKEHIFEIIGLLITICGLDVFVRLLQYQYAGYILAGIIFVWLLVFILRSKFIKPQNRVTYTNYLIYPRHPDKIWSIKGVQIFGVNWEIFLGSNRCPDEILQYLQSDQKDNEEYENWINQNIDIWVHNPFCIDCNCELDTDDKKANWVCPKCGKKVNIPKQIWHDPDEKVAKIFKSEWRNINIDYRI